MLILWKAARLSKVNVTWPCKNSAQFCCGHLRRRWRPMKWSGCMGGGDGCRHFYPNFVEIRIRTSWNTKQCMYCFTLLSSETFKTLSTLPPFQCLVLSKRDLLVEPSMYQLQNTRATKHGLLDDLSQLWKFLSPEEPSWSLFLNAMFLLFREAVLAKDEEAMVIILVFNKNFYPI